VSPRRPAARATTRSRAWSRVLLLLLLLALVGGAGTARAQDAVPAQDVEAAPAEAAQSPVAAPAAGDEGGAAARPVAPRSMRPYWHLFIAFGLTWVLLLGYVVSLARRFARLEETAHQLGRNG